MHDGKKVSLKSRISGEKMFLMNSSTIVEPASNHLASMGSGEVAYIRVLKTEEAQSLFSKTMDFPPSIPLYVLFAADGAPIMVADNREVILTNLWDRDLELAKVH